MLIPVFNPETADLEKSYLTAPYSAGVTAIVVKNSNRFAAQDRIMIGEMGQEKTEVVTVSAVDANGTNLTVGATKFSHSADDPIYKLRFDQVKFYRSTDGGVNYNVLSTEDLDVDNADLTTKYDDTAGTAAYYYKFTFYHSISGVESADSDVIKGSGWRREQVGNLIDEILQEVSDPTETHITRGELLGYFNDVNDDLQVNASRPYEFLRARTALARTANQSYLDFPVDSDGKQVMWKFDRMDYNYTDNTTSPATDRTTTIPVLSMEDFRNRYSNNTVDATTVTDKTPDAMTLDTAVDRFRFSKPFETSLSNVFYLYYWKYFDTITSEGGIIETPTPKIYKLYAKGMYYRKRGVTEASYNNVSDRYFADYQIEKNKYKGVDKKDKGSPLRFKPATPTYRRYRGN